MNPELRRYLWLEFSPGRLLAMPLLWALGLGIWALYAAKVGFQSYSYSELNQWALTAFALLSAGWGGRAASLALAEDIRAGTWDFQRLSSMSPAGLGFGKLFGCTAYSWYGAAFALATYGVAECFYHPLALVLEHCCIVLLTGWLFQGTLFFVSLQYGRATSRTRTRQAFVFIPAFFAAIFAFSAIQEMNTASGQSATVYWYGTTYAVGQFLLTLEVFLSAWLAVGIYARMRTQLRLPRIPYFWPIFVASMLVFGKGFPVTYRFPVLGLSLCFIYFAAVLESWDGISYRRLQFAIAERNIRHIFEMLPNWILATAISAVICVVACFRSTPDTAFLGVAWFFFALRDIGILHYFSFLPSRKRAMTNVVLWLLGIYVIVPILAAASGQPTLANLFVPKIKPLPQYLLTDPLPAYQATIAGIIEAAIAAYYAYRRWQRHWKA